jgi:putative membrane protein
MLKMMSKRKRLHPIATIGYMGKRIKNFIFPIAAFTFSVTRDSGRPLLFAIIVFLVTTLFIFITSLLSWLRYTYILTEDELRIEEGIFVRKKRYIPYERIQSINFSEGMLQRLFGLVKVQIETAGGNGAREAEAVLSAISKEEAQQVQEYAASVEGNRTIEVKDIPEAYPIYKISNGQLLILSLTSGGVGVVISAVLALLSQVDDLIPFRKLASVFEKWDASSLVLIAIIVFFGFFLAWVLALMGTMLKYANFTVLKKDNDLVITQGLLERRQITIPLKRIQAIRISENILRQTLGLATVYVESAGGSSANQEGSKVTLLPIVKLNQIGSIIELALGNYQFAANFTPLPKRAMWRYIFRNWYIAVPIVILSLILLKTWGLLSFLLLGVMTLWAVFKYKTAGWNLTDQQLILKYRTFIRTTVIMQKSKIQSLEIRESYFQQKRNLGTLEVFVKSGAGGAGGKVVDMEKEDIKKIYEWYSRGKEKRDCSER